MRIAATHVWLCAVCTLATAARPRPRGEDLYRQTEEEEVAAAGEGGRVVLVADDPYRLYRARADQHQLDDDDYRVRLPAPTQRKEAPRAPPVQTIRNYNKVNDDGSFTFGYEAADGSFKEETRGTDCVVRGKYGYVDPDGNKREFTYVSGNPCDPNRPDEDEDNGADSPEVEDDSAANYPSPPPQRRPPPTTARPPTTYFQNDYRDEDEEPLRPLQRPRLVQRPRPVAPAPLAITPRPQPVITAAPPPPPTTFRPQLLSVPFPSHAPQPQYQLTAAPVPLRHTSPRPAPQAIDFAAEFAKFQRDNSPSGSPGGAAGGRPAVTSAPLYSTQLVLDQASGQYDTQLYQALPQTKGELNLNQRLQSFVAAPSPRPFVPSQQLYRPQPAAPVPSQESYQRQQAEAQFANSAQLFQQQQQLQHSQLQRDRAAARQHAQRLAARPAPLQYYAQSDPDAYLRPQHTAIQF